MTSLQLEGSRTSVSWLHRELSNTLLVYTNGRSLCLDPEQARQIARGILAVLDQTYEEALTDDLVERPRAASARPISATHHAVPTLEDI